MNAKQLIFLLSLMAFPSDSFSQAYCCCNDDQCIGGDGHVCCSTGYHPIISCSADHCSGVGMYNDYWDDLKNHQRNYCDRKLGQDQIECTDLLRFKTSKSK